METETFSTRLVNGVSRWTPMKLISKSMKTLLIQILPIETGVKTLIQSDSAEESAWNHLSKTTTQLIRASIEKREESLKSNKFSSFTENQLQTLTLAALS